MSAVHRRMPGARSSVGGDAGSPPIRRINDRIRAPQVRLVGADGQQIGVVDTREALRQARDLDLDLVEVAPQARPPVCRIMDYGKFKYERDVRQKEARKKQSRTGLKEIKFRPKIDPHDYATKKGHVERFLKGGPQGQGHDHVPGARDGAHGPRSQDPGPAGRGPRRDRSWSSPCPKQEGRNMIMVIAPNKRYAEAHSQAMRGEGGPRGRAADERAGTARPPPSPTSRRRPSRRSSSRRSSRSRPPHPSSEG